MRHARPDHAAIQPWPAHRPHLVLEVETGTIIQIKGTHDRSIDEAIESGRLAPLIPVDEPVFILRARDLAGPTALRHYAEAAKLAGADPRLVLNALEHADEMERYADEHYGGGEVPDLPPPVPEYPIVSATDDAGRTT